MAPRRYDRSRRDEAMAETRARIVDAVVDLHAELGPTRTTYAMIARRADVAIPTVYKHFPAPAALFAACIGHVSAQVPPLGPDIFAGHGDTAARLGALARALFGRHKVFAPWLRWSRRETHLLQDMAVYLVKMRERHLRLIRAALEHDHGAEPPARLVAVVEVLTGFDAWHTMVAESGIGADEAADAVAQALAALVCGGAQTVDGDAAVSRPRRVRSRATPAPGGRRERAPR